MAERYDPKKALNSPGHITLFPPFKFPESKEKVLLKSIKEVIKSQDSFPVFLSDFDVFKPRVIFVNVENGVEWTVLYEKLSSIMDKILPGYSSDSRPFRPHATIASRDLRKSEFHKAWIDFKKRKYERFFAANHVCLLKHDGKKWEIRDRIFFRK